MKDFNNIFANQWAMILGGSSGFGLATATKLADHGMNLIVIHRDRKGTMPEIDEAFARIRAKGVQLVTYNCNALEKSVRDEVVDKITAIKGVTGNISLLLHSIALGNLKPVFKASADQGILEDDELAETIYNMGTSLYSWVKALHHSRLFADRAQALGLTSEGNQLAIKGYGAVSVAKCALEAISRSIAVEYAPSGLRCNILQPGVTWTKALRLIPGHELMAANAKKRNPFGRLTIPEDVANVIYLLCLPEARWINGCIIPVDGGERISSFGSD